MFGKICKVGEFCQQFTFKNVKRNIFALAELKNYSEIGIFEFTT